MTLIPGFINSSGGSPSYDAAGLRMIDSVDLTPGDSAVDPLGVRSGIRPSGAGSFAVSISGGTSIDVAPGYAVLGDYPGAQGAYRVALDSTFSTPVTARDATYSRIDAVYLHVRDTDVDGLGFRDALIGVEVGTPAPTPAEPSIPEGALLLAIVTVPETGGGSITVEDRRVFTVAAGGVLPAAGRPSGPFSGQAIFRLDTGDLEVFDGSDWVAYAPAEVAAIRLSPVGAESRNQGAEAPLNWNTEEASGGASLNAEGSTRILLPAGLWSVAYQVNVDGGDAGSNASAALTLNGSAVAEPWITNNGSKDVSISATKLLRIADGDELEVLLKNNNSTAQVSSFGSESQVWFTAYRIGD